MKNKMKVFFYKNIWAILVVIVGIIIWGVRLEMTVKAVSEKGADLRNDYENSEELLVDVRERVIRIEKDVEFIREHVDVD